MKRNFVKSISAALCAVVMFTGCAQKSVNSGNETYNPGKYEAEAKGFGGQIKVEVEVDSNKILNVTIKEASETDGIGSKAVESLPALIVEKNSVEIDNVSGATVSSEAIKQAAQAALSKAKKDSLSAAITMKAGTYTATTKGNNGDVVVEVVVSKTAIESVKVIEHKESAGIYDVPFEVIPEQVVEYQTTNPDVISGATVSSNALITGITECLKQAGADLSMFNNNKVAKAEKTEEVFDEYNVVVVGGGLSGLTAACSAAQNGAKVALIEKQAFLGGTTMLATGTIRYAEEGDGTSMVESILDEGADFREEGDKYPLMDYLNAIGETSHKSTELYNNAGLNMLPVDGRPYVQKPEADGKAGVLYIQKLEKYLEELGGTIYKSTPATELIKSEDGSVKGIISDTDDSKKTFKTDAVILASGDFARNEELIAEYNPISTGNFTGTAVGNVGDGLGMAVDAGAALWDDMFSMGGAFVFNPYDSYRAGMRESETLDNSLFVSITGERRIDESASSKFVHAVFKNETEADGCWAIMDSKIAAETEVPIDQMIAENGGARIAYEANSIEELAELMGVDPAVLTETVNRYNELCEKGVDEDFGKNSELMVPIKEGKYYAVRAYCVTRGIAGGVQTNTSAEVLKEDGTTIKGLYASGAIASRPFYGGAYQGAAALSVAGNMGYIAGENAAKSLK